MKRGWFIAGVAALVLVGVVAVAEARGPGGGWGGAPGAGSGYGRGGMMGGGPGMMGGGPGMWQGGDMPCQYDGATYDPATALARAELNIERQQLMLGAQQAHLAVLQTQPKTWQEALLLTARAEVDYWSKATAANADNQAWIALRLEQAKQHLTYVEAQQPKTN